MLNDILVVGTSIASGVGRGHEKQPEALTVKSWVQYLAEMTQAKNVWNHSFPGKPLGLVNADAVEFGKQYYDRYRSFEDLFVILEYSFPSYKHWDPVAAVREDCAQMNIIPVAYFKPMQTLEQATGEMYYRGNNFLETKFLHRRTTDLLSHNNHPHHMYEEADQDDVLPEELQKFEHLALEWFRPSEENRLRYLKYAFDEILSAQNYCEHNNIPYMQTWVGGLTDGYKRGVDRYLKPLMQNNRLVPMTEFTAASYTLEHSQKTWRNHPDEHGHKKTAEFYYDWILKHNLHERPNSNLYRGFSNRA
jgi:hypothetical protein